MPPLRLHFRVRTLLPVLALAVTFAVAAPAAAAPHAEGDFNGDGRADLAVGAPSDSVHGRDTAGAVNVLYGSDGGLRAAGDQQFTQDTRGVLGAAESADRFGATLAAGDFDGDGFADLAIGTPGESVGGERNAGAVNVLYGSARGLTSRDQLWHQDSRGIEGLGEGEDNFAVDLATGDLNGDGRADLAIGVRDESASGARAAGAVNVIYGSPGGLSSAGDQLWHQDVAGVLANAGAFNRFGFAVAIDDLDGDGREDLAIGVPGERIRGRGDAGAASVLYGAPGGVNASRDQLWHQASAGIEGFAERGDNFGRALAIADFDGDGRADLAVGVPFEDIHREEVGAVNVIYGAPGGLRATGDEVWSQHTSGIQGRAERGDRFGLALAAADLSGNGAAELIAGVPAEGVAGSAGAGAINVIYGRSGGLTTDANQLWHQGRRGIQGAVEDFDRFGRSAAAGDLNGDGAYDLAAGVPGEGVSGVARAGAVNVLYGSLLGVSARSDQLWHQGSGGIQGALGEDRFGSALGTGAP